MFDKIIVLATEECMNEIIPAVNMTSYEYYKKLLSQYTNELLKTQHVIRDNLIEKYGSIEAYYNDIIKPIVIPNNPGKKLSREVFEEFNEFGNDTNIYLDFTGGSRVASFIAVLIIRILENCSANIKSIIYANIQKESEIIDLTENYNMLISIEKLAIAKEAHDTKEILNQLKEYIPDISENDLDSAEKISDVVFQEKTNLKKETTEENQKKLSSLLNESRANTNPITVAVLNKGIETAKKELQVSPFEKLKNMKTDDLIQNFYEEIIGIMVDMDVIVGVNPDLSKEQVKNEIKTAIKANDKYYSKLNKRGIEVSGVCHYVYKILNNSKNKNYNPLTNYEIKSSIMFISPNYDQVSNSRFVIGISNELNNKFLDYLERNDYLEELLSHKKGKELLIEFSKLERIYYNYGFPFACVNDGVTYDAISEYYLSLTKELMINLSELKKKSRVEYDDTINQMLNDRKVLEERIPYMIKMEDIWDFNHDKCKRLGVNESDFIRTLCKRLSEVRIVRNAIAHKLKNEYSKPETKKEVADKILSWINEYEEMIGN